MKTIGKIFTDFSMLSFDSGCILNMGLDIANIAALIISVVVLFGINLARHKELSPLGAILKSNVIIRIAISLLLLFTILIFGIYGPGYSESQFIYFQF